MPSAKGNARIMNVMYCFVPGDEQNNYSATLKHGDIAPNYWAIGDHINEKPDVATPYGKCANYWNNHIVLTLRTLLFLFQKTGTDADGFFALMKQFIKVCYFAYL